MGSPGAAEEVRSRVFNLEEENASLRRMAELELPREVESLKHQVWRTGILGRVVSVFFEACLLGAAELVAILHVVACFEVALRCWGSWVSLFSVRHVVSFLFSFVCWCSVL